MVQGQRDRQYSIYLVQIINPQNSVIPCATGRPSSPPPRPCSSSLSCWFISPVRRTINARNANTSRERNASANRYLKIRRLSRNLTLKLDLFRMTWCCAMRILSGKIFAPSLSCQPFRRFNQVHHRPSLVTDWNSQAEWDGDTETHTQQNRNYLKTHFHINACRPLDKENLNAVLAHFRRFQSLKKRWKH